MSFNIISCFMGYAILFYLLTQKTEDAINNLSPSNVKAMIANCSKNYNVLLGQKVNEILRIRNTAMHQK